MMKTAEPIQTSKTRRYVLQGLLVLAAGGLVVSVVLSDVDSDSPVFAQQAAEEAQPMEYQLYKRYMLLRRRMGLEGIDLAAMDLSQSEAEAVLTRLVSWCDTNQQAMEQAQSAVNNAERGLAEQDRLVRIGQASPAQLADNDGKRTAVSNALQAYEDLLEEGARHALQASPSKIPAWERAIALNNDTPHALRYVSTVDETRLDQLKAEAKRQGVKIDRALSYGEQQELATIRTRINSNIDAMHEVEEAVMPLPLELRPVPDELLVPPQREGAGG